MARAWYPDSEIEIGQPPCSSSRGPSYARGSQLASACHVTDDDVLTVAYVHMRSIKPASERGLALLRALRAQFLEKKDHACGYADQNHPRRGLHMSGAELHKHNQELADVRTLFLGHLGEACAQVIVAASQMPHVTENPSNPEHPCAVLWIVTKFQEFLQELLQEYEGKQDDPFLPMWHASQIVAQRQRLTPFQSMMLNVHQFERFTYEYVSMRQQHGELIMQQHEGRTQEQTRALLDAMLAVWEMCSAMPLFMDAMFLQTTYGKKYGCVMDGMRWREERLQKRWRDPDPTKHVSDLKPRKRQRLPSPSQSPVGSSCADANAEAIDVS